MISHGFDQTSEEIQRVQKEYVIQMLQWQADHVVEQLEDGHANAYSPQCKWSEREWIAKLDGELTILDRASESLCHDIGGSFRDSLRGFKTLCDRLEFANKLCRQHRDRLGMGVPL
jgi:hypothetical protein